MSADARRETPSQTAGPYVHIGCLPEAAGVAGVYARAVGAAMISEGAVGRRIRVSGVIYDGEDAPVRDALLEVWQADAAGRYPGPSDPRGGADPAVAGFARRMSDFKTGLWTLETVKPGSVPGPDGRPMAPHLSLWIAARGVNLALHTRLYFPDDAEANAACPVLSAVGEPERRATLVATADGPDAYRFDIRLQGADETVFFDV